MRIFIRNIFSISSPCTAGLNIVRSASKGVQFREYSDKKKDAAATKQEGAETKPQKKIEEVRKYVVVEKFDGITTLNIDRRNMRNALNEETLRQIEAALNAFDQDNDATVLVINGEGGSFCSGFDLYELGTKGYNILKDAATRLRRRPLCEKPTVAAVSGYAVAEGFELAMACDLRVIEETACIGCLGRRFGAPQALSGASRLTSLLGLSRAMNLLLTGRLISGKEAHEFGLACKLTATGTALGESIKLAKSLTKFPQAALMMDKMQAVQSVLNPTTEESMRDEAIAQSLLGQAMEDMKAGTEKFRKGVGRHGKFYRLTDVPLKDWELEDSESETIYTKTESKKQ